MWGNDGLWSFEEGGRAGSGIASSFPRYKSIINDHFREFGNTKMFKEKS